MWIWTFGEHHGFHPEKIVLFTSRNRQRRTILQEIFPSGRQIHSNDDNGVLKVTGIRVTALSLKKNIVIALYVLETLNKGSTVCLGGLGACFHKYGFIGIQPCPLLIYFLWLSCYNDAAEYLLQRL